DVFLYSPHSNSGTRKFIPLLESQQKVKKKVLPGLSRIRRLSPCRPSVIDIETLEEIEDRIALGQVPSLSNTVHFRSRLSLIPEQVPSTVEECEEPSESSHVLSIEENTDSPTPASRSRLQNVISGLLSKRKSKDPLSPSSERSPSS
ncbi:hypothetical protein GCK32_020542, partial [Trichostrongylus colubriformis]